MKGHLWGTLRDKLSVAEILEICFGDTLDGDEMCKIAHEALVNMEAHLSR